MDTMNGEWGAPKLDAELEWAREHVAQQQMEALWTVNVGQQPFVVPPPRGYEPYVPQPAVGEDAPLAAGKGDHAFTLHHSICRHCGISLLRALLNDVWSCVPVTVPGAATAVRDDSALLRAVRR